MTELKTEPDFRIGEHVRVATRQLPGALAPAQVTPYCSRCGVAWPCPQATLEIERQRS